MSPKEKAAVRAICDAAVAAVDPGAAVRRHAILRGSELRAAGAALDLDAVRRVRVLGAGKATPEMARALVGILGDRISDGLAVGKRGGGDEGAIGPVEIVRAGHPVPDERGLAAARRVARMADELGPEDLLVALISGGGSSLLPLPAEGISLADLAETTDLLLRSGAEIREVNAIRKHLSAIAGGQLARRAAPARVVGLALSDVVGDPLDGIASGPTAPDPTTFADALGTIGRLGLEDALPAAVANRLRRGAAGEIPDTPGPDDPVFLGVSNTVVAGNRLAVEAAAAAARDMGMETSVVDAPLEGEAREAGRRVATMVREEVARAAADGRPRCLALGGETAVTVRGSGKGGRNQELALAAAIDLEGLDGAVVVSLATDGEDGPTDAAGAVADWSTAARARAAGLEPSRVLEDNDSYRLFDALGDLVVTGPTGTNVADVALAIAFLP